MDETVRVDALAMIGRVVANRLNGQEPVPELEAWCDMIIYFFKTNDISFGNGINLDKGMINLLIQDFLELCKHRQLRDDIVHKLTDEIVFYVDNLKFLNEDTLDILTSGFYEGKFIKKD